jgi:potassium efflux system protein
MLVLGASLLALLRPRRKRSAEDQDVAPVWPRRLYLHGSPAIVLTTLLPALLAALGYYLSAILLTYQMMRTLWLALVLLLLAGLVLRWRVASLRGISRDTEGPTDEAGAMTELPQAEAQVWRLFRFVFFVFAFVGLYSIWSEALPMLQVFKRVQVWPSVRVIGATDTSVLALTRPSGGTAGDTPAEPAADEGAAAPAVPGLPAPTTSGFDTAATAAESTPLTLWKILESLLAIAATVALVKNLPGLLELALRRRTRLDGGARIALGTLVRYAILIVGVSTAFGFLGISWSKIQWLAAALTFGLGFGLQEIVANFVSGLILLVERPVRVGDAVTVGNLQGRVSRIQIRATTITLWDRSEMVVPNKEFITTKLVNWTLSDSQRRVGIPIRVAYGADLDKVKQTLLGVARSHADVSADPAPHVLVLDFGNDAMNFELRYYVDFGKGLSTQDEIQMGIDRAFRREGIEFALPRLNIDMPRRRSR